jgi:predicted nucleic acid-binding protein
MTRYVIDAATLLHLAARGVVTDPGHQLVAPGSLRSQALQLLLEGVRDGRLTEEQAMEQHERITELRMRLLGDRVSRRTAWRLARELDVTIVVAEYLAVARLQADALVALDPELVAAASGVVPLASVEDLVAG